MTNTAIVASNIVGIRLVRAISVCKVWTKAKLAKVRTGVVAVITSTGLVQCYHAMTMVRFY